MGTHPFQLLCGCWCGGLLTLLPVCLLSLSSAPQLWPLPLLQPNLWLQLVPCSPEVCGLLGWSKHWCRTAGTYKTCILCLGVQTAWIATDKIGWTLTVQTRCDWTSKVNIWLSVHPMLTILLHYTWADQKCNLWRVLQWGQLHRLPGNPGDGGYDPSVKQLW